VVIHSKKQKHCGLDELTVGDCWIGVSLVKSSGLILSGRVGKHTDLFLAELVASTEGKTDCKLWDTEDLFKNKEIWHS
jgi:insertion element IS1 protein InsB